MNKQRLQTTVNLDQICYEYLLHKKASERISISEYVNLLVMKDIIEKTHLDNE